MTQEQYEAELAQQGLKPFPWLTVLGLGAGAVAIYFVYQHYTGTKKLGTIERPESDDLGPRLRSVSKSMGHFKGSGRSTCRPPKRRRLGGLEEKYEFEPEIRLEGYRGSRRHKGVRR